MHITIIDDENILATKIQKKLEIEWYTTSVFNSYQSFINNPTTTSQLYIIDISLWDGSGFDIIAWLRTTIKTNAPVLIMSGYGDSEKIIYGLNIWADDYLTKPFVPDELIARVRALLRRPTEIIEKNELTLRWIVFDKKTREVRVNNQKIYLAQKESALLEFLLEEKDKIISREKLITYVWWGNRMEEVSDNTINVTISKLRRKIWEDFSLKMLYGHGYIFE